MSYINEKVGINFNKDPYEYIPLPSIVFIVTVYNNEEYIANCLESIISQNFDKWRCIIIDDASTDSTWSIINNFISLYPLKLSGIKNICRKWKIANLIAAISECQNDDVIVEIDGDDYLLQNNVALELAELHRKFDVVWTQHEIDYKICPDWHTWYSTPLPDNWTRIEPWRPTLWTRYMHPGHLRTFKCRYFNLIRENDFLWNGEFLKACADAAYYTAIIELTPSYLRYFYARPCLCYRITNGSDTLNEFFTENLPDIERQTAISNYLKFLPPYLPIRIFNIFIPMYDIQDQYIVYNALSWIHKYLPFAKLSVGISKPQNIEMPTSCGNCTVYNVDKIMNNFFTKAKLSHRPYKELFLIMSIDYVFRHTNVSHLIVITDPEIVYALKECDFDISKWIPNKGVVYLQRSPELLSSIFKYFRDGTFMINRNPIFQKII
ncbi:MAG: glycosyltransferase family 2 protein [Bacteroidota bacterium]